MRSFCCSLSASDLFSADDETSASTLREKQNGLDDSSSNLLSSGEHEQPVVPSTYESSNRTGITFFKPGLVSLDTDAKLNALQKAQGEYQAVLGHVPKQLSAIQELLNSEREGSRAALETERAIKDKISVVEKSLSEIISLIAKIKEGEKTLLITVNEQISTGLAGNNDQLIQQLQEMQKENAAILEKISALNDQIGDIASNDLTNNIAQLSGAVQANNQTLQKLKNDFQVIKISDNLSAIDTALRDVELFSLSKQKKIISGAIGLVEQITIPSNDKACQLKKNIVSGRAEKLERSYSKSMYLWASGALASSVVFGVCLKPMYNYFERNHAAGIFAGCCLAGFSLFSYFKKKPTDESFVKKYCWSVSPVCAGALINFASLNNTMAQDTLLPTNLLQNANPGVVACGVGVLSLAAMIQSNKQVQSYGILRSSVKTLGNFVKDRRS